MSSILKEIDRLAGILRTLTPMQEECQQKLDKKFRLEFSFNTNHIEGNTLTYKETELLLVFDETKGNHSLREYEEMKAHDMAFHLTQEWTRDKEHHLTESDIKSLNSIILVRSFWKDAITSDGQPTKRQIKVGGYKEHPNSVRLENGEIFHYISPSETPIKMGELMAWYREQEMNSILHPVELAALFHYKFVRIHPFDDGNGRISRLLMNYVLLHHGLAPVIIRSADKKNYLRALHEADAGDEGAFIHYIAQQQLWSLDISIKAAKGESIDEPGDLDKKLSLLKQTWGEDPNEKVALIKSNTTVKRFIDISLKTFIHTLQKRIEKFDSFLFSRRGHIAFTYPTATYTFSYEGEDLVQVLEQIYSSKFIGRPDIYFNPHTITISYKPLGVRPLFKEIELVTVPIEIRLQNYFYTITSPGSQSIIKKIYNYDLTEDEIDRIVEEWGTILLDSLEKKLEGAPK